MAERRPRTPRSYFGLSPAPQPGLQEPVLSPSMSQRFSDAGLQDLTPYINPWETVALARDYRAVESDLAVQDAEDRFIQRLQRDPSSATTGLQKFLAEDPRLIASPMFRAYAVTQDRLAQKPKTDPYALDAAEAGKDFLDAYNKDIASGVPQLDAFAAHRSRIAEAKKKAPEDERLTLSGTPKEEFDTAVSEYLQAQDYEPTEDEKRAFLPAGKKDLTEKDWSDAWYKAREQRQSEALKKLDRIRKVYGGFYKMPQGMNQAPVVAGPPVGPEQISAANQTAPAVSETVTATPAGATEAVTSQAPESLPRDEEAEKMWGEYMELENTMRVDAESTNPADWEADRELREEKKKLQESIMKRLRIPNTKEGNKLFQQVWQGRRNSMAESEDSRGKFLTQPLQKTGATGNTWVIRPA